MLSAEAYLVFTDLDGTLLDHDSYSFAPALPALAALARRGIPCILNTSKTAAELLSLRTALGNRYPFIVENGAAIVQPDDSLLAVPGVDSRLAGLPAKCFATPRAKVLECLQALRAEQGYDFLGFADMSVDDLVAEAGLPAADAERALQRDFSEPILWRDSEARWQAFCEHVEAAGLQILRGGRFAHIMGRTDKGRAMAWLCAALAGDRPLHSIALGDSHNDVAMLARADIAVIVRSPKHAPPTLRDCRGALHTTEEYGPAGWNSSMLAILADLAGDRSGLGCKTDH